MAASGVYSLEPQTHGCVRLKTTAGDLLIDLFSREAPQAVQNFCQLVVDGKYDKAPFHRIIPQVLVQAGFEEVDDDIPSFKDEFHSRLEFRGRGFVAMANEGKPHTNRSQFFITLKPTPWLNRKHTIFGIIRGDPVFVAVKIGDSFQENEKALEPYIILSGQIVEQPFPEFTIVRKLSPAVTILEESGEKRKPAAPLELVKVKKNLISFDDDEEEEIIENKKKTPFEHKLSQKINKRDKLISASDEEEDDDKNDDVNEKVMPGNSQQPPLPRKEDLERDSRLSAKLAAFKAKRNL